MKYDILSVHDQSTNLLLEGNQFHALKSKEIRRYGVRRFENGKMYQASRLGFADTDRLLADTKEWGGPGTSHEYGFAPAHQEKREGKVTKAEWLKEFQGSVEDLKARFPNYVFGGECEVRQRKTSLTSNYGLDLSSSKGVCHWSVFYQRKGSGNMFDGYFGEACANPSIGVEIASHEEYLEKQTNEVKLQSGRMPVLFTESLQPLGKLLQSLMANLYFENACVFRGRLGQELFSKQITLFDEAYDPETGNTEFFDGEGVVRKKDRLNLIENGRFASLMCDLRFAKKYNYSSTGNGMRGYNTGVNLSAHSLRFAFGEKPWREILKSLDRCVVAMIAAGGDSNDLGEFSTPVQVGYVFEKGELIGRTPQITVKTSVSRYLNEDLIAVSSDGFHKSSPSACLISEVDVFTN